MSAVARAERCWESCSRASRSRLWPAAARARPPVPHSVAKCGASPPSGTPRVRGASRGTGRRSTRSSRRGSRSTPPAAFRRRSTSTRRAPVGCPPAGSRSSRRITLHAHRLGPVVVAIPATDTLAYPGGALVEAGADLLLPMLYDQHWAGGAPGPVAEPRWVSAALAARRPGRPRRVDVGLSATRVTATVGGCRSDPARTGVPTRPQGPTLARRRRTSRIGVIADREPRSARAPAGRENSRLRPPGPV